MSEQTSTEVETPKPPASERAEVKRFKPPQGAGGKFVSKSKTSERTERTESGGTATWAWVVLGLAVLGAGGAVGFAFWRRRRGSAGATVH
jgi:hypothetical protein